MGDKIYIYSLHNNMIHEAFFNVQNVDLMMVSISATLKKFSFFTVKFFKLSNNESNTDNYIELIVIQGFLV